MSCVFKQCFRSKTYTRRRSETDYALTSSAPSDTVREIAHVGPAVCHSDLSSAESHPSSPGMQPRAGHPGLPRRNAT
ncbi:hypothetical protein DPMN_019894 [Dreissena polymorpha]|uniref:Uncharacterized protein n=1 Tax=Dreissena polymorpha TaxID=45954 RepID=A0A9D4NLL6_DREPO|nr:hypothetical protein DPMN_019894 [Dreissena polymorpha]